MKGRVVESLIDVVHSKGIADNDQEELILALTLFSKHNIDVAACILGVKAAGPNASHFSFDSGLNKRLEHHPSRNAEGGQ